MRKKFLGILLSFIGFTSCAAKGNVDNMQKVDVYVNGEKRVFYKSNDNSQIQSTKVISTKNYLVFYLSPNKNPNTKVILKDELLIFIPKNKSVKELEDKYSIKFKKYINKKMRLALFKVNNINDLIKVINKLNKEGIKADFNSIRKLNLY